ncbi:MAG: ATP--guanido phosphotransferase [Firmicutes bacterium]|nr:ATP--guanido phosphotransferase [Bacillota bacterium]
MYWYECDGKDKDVVLSTRIRFARNIDKTPFPTALDKEAAERLAERISALFDREKYAVNDIKKLSEAERGAFVEAHLASPEFCREPYDGKRLILSKDGDASVMVGEEDHIRLQVIRSGFDLQETYKKADEIEKMLSEKLDFAFSESLGYLTCCPTNLGSGMRASAMLHLPALTVTGGIGKLTNSIAPLGYTVRGLYGEGSEAAGMIYQISNVPSVSQTEEEILRGFEEVISTVIKSERSARKYLSDNRSDKLTDRIGRAFGTLKYAGLISGKEFLANYSFARLGVCLGQITETALTTLDRAAIELMPATLTLCNLEASDAVSRDRIRAAELRKRLSEKPSAQQR